MKPLIWIIYASIILVAVIFLSIHRQPTTSGEFIAANNLAANRLLQPNDAILAPFGHRYLRRAVVKGEHISANDFASMPSVAVPEGMLPIVVAVTNARVEQLMNAGDQARFCPAPEGDPGPMKVYAVLCDDANISCIATVAITKSSADSVEKVMHTAGVALQTKACE